MNKKRIDIMDITQGVPFDSFGLSEPTMRAIRNKGYTVSTPVQAGCIPPMLAGKDVIAKAPTGTLWFDESLLHAHDVMV